MIVINFLIADAKGDQFVLKIHLFPNAGWNFQSIDDLVAGWRVIIGNLISGALLRITVALEYPGLPALADLNSDVQERAAFQFGDGKRITTTTMIPTFLESLFVPDSDQVDRSQPAVSAFTTAMLEGFITSGGVEWFPTDRRGEIIGSIHGSGERWGKAR